jgi:hypothetical protein
MDLDNLYFFTGNSYAGKSTMVHLLAQKYDGIECGENYHDNYDEPLDAKEFPALCYTRDLKDWHDFIRRTPEEYAQWVADAKKECEIIELRMLEKMQTNGRKVFVDTNICPETLHKITDRKHVMIMLAPRDMAIRRFFDRPDKEKQFLYQLMMEEPDPQAALENYRKGLELICSQESYDEYLNCGFEVNFRDDSLGVEGTMALIEKKLGLSLP